MSSSVSTDRALAVRCRGVTKDFGAGGTRVQALRGVDLDVFTGEMTLLVGPSGCGKTTLLSVIAGILEPTAGSVEVLGTDLVHLSARQVVRFRGQRIGFVFQQFNLLPALSALENIAVPLLIAGTRRRKALARAREMALQVGLEDRMHALPADLSGGQQQRVAIARALVAPAAISCLRRADVRSRPCQRQADHGAVARRGGGSNRAVIVVTHDNRVFEFGDRIAHMDDGHIERSRGKAHNRTCLGAMIIKYVLPLVALAASSSRSSRSSPRGRNKEDVPPPIEPSRSPYKDTVAGAGIVEAQTENIEIGATMPGLVVKVYVKVHDKVDAGDPLFKLDDRQLKADLEVRKAAVDGRTCRTVAPGKPAPARSSCRSTKPR